MPALLRTHPMAQRQPLRRRHHYRRPPLPPLAWPLAPQNSGPIPACTDAATPTQRAPYRRAREPTRRPSYPHRRNSMSARDLWVELGKPYVRPLYRINYGAEEADRIVAAFWASETPEEGRCCALPLTAWEECRGARGPWCRYPMPCGLHKPKPPKPPKPAVVRRSKAQLESENVVLRRRLNLLLAADALQGKIQTDD